MFVLFVLSFIFVTTESVLISVWEIVSVINTGVGVPGCLQQTSWSAYQGLFIIMEGGNHRDASIVFKSSSSHPPQPSTALHPLAVRLVRMKYFSTIRIQPVVWSVFTNVKSLWSDWFPLRCKLCCTLPCLALIKSSLEKERVKPFRLGCNSVMLKHF